MGLRKFIVSAMLAFSFNAVALPRSAAAQDTLSTSFATAQTTQAMENPANDLPQNLPRAHVEERRGANYAAIVLDAETGEVLYDRDADKRLDPASTTKIMTSYLVFEAIREGKLQLDQKLTVSAHAGKFGGPNYRTNLALRKGAKITVRDALAGMLVHSSNDAAVVLAEAVSGTEAKFVKKMNDTAERLGMRSSRFINPNGWPDKPEYRQKSSVRDMSILCIAVMKEFPDQIAFFNQRNFTYQKTPYKNTNHMLMDDYDGLDFSKTGYTKKAGSNLVTSAVRDGHRVIAVVFGAKDKFQRKEDITLLLDYGFLRTVNPYAVYPPTAEQYEGTGLSYERHTPAERIESRPIVSLTPQLNAVSLKIPTAPSYSALETLPTSKSAKKDERKKEKKAAKEKAALLRQKS